MMDIPRPVKIAAVAAGVSYAVYNELENRHGLVSDLSLALKVSSYRREVARSFKEHRNIVDFWYETVARVGQSKPAIVMCEEDGSSRTLTFGDLEAYSNQVANLLLSEGLKPEDTIALFMENRPEFIATWLGASKVGVRVAMINTSIVHKGLAHCLNVSNAKSLFYGSELEDSLSQVLDQLNGMTKLFCQGASPKIDSALHVDQILKPFAKTLDNRGREHRTKVGFGSIWGYIYTSGTTGLPKAAVILHSKMYVFGGGIRVVFGCTQNDVLYTCLPLFHSAGGGLGAGMMVTGGMTMILRKKFSVKHFFSDCAKYKVTVVQYIGELCRYLLASSPNNSVDKNHQIRIAIGNGLRPEIWKEFQTRFNIPEIGEFYGSTEGNGSLFNHCKGPEAIGAVGRFGTLLKRITGMKLAKYDVENDQLVRTKEGRCIEVGESEAGELLMPIKPNDPTTSFPGYSDQKATEKKIVRDAFVKGDMYFSSGDLLSRDSKGYYRFVDRIGDTFRWKGENCSTTEVTEVVSTFPGIEEANVYGVLIPNNQDGRAPCAAITPADGDLSKLDLNKFREHCQTNLPSYAVPLFLRITPQIAITATLKHQKGELRKDGIDISKVKDPLFYLDSQQGYVPLDAAVYGRITTPNARL